MWICLNDAFLSIVRKDCDVGCLLVRARREGDIEKLFPRAVVSYTPRADYLYRAVVPETEVMGALSIEVSLVDYDNFKNSIEDKRLHDAYLKVWTAMLDVQPFERFPESKPKKKAKRK